MRLMSALLVVAASGVSYGEPADHDFYKTACVWNATGAKLDVQFEFDDLDPYTAQLPAGGWTSYSWFQAKGTSATPPLKLWYQGAPAIALDTSVAPTVLAVLDTEQVRDCTQLRRYALHYRIEEAYDSNGAVTGYSLRGPIANP